MATDKRINADIYEYMEFGGNVYDDIRDLSYNDMEDYFQDQDPAAFL